jgi:hypothetical protein
VLDQGKELQADFHALLQINRAWCLLSSTGRAAGSWSIGNTYMREGARPTHKAHGLNATYVTPRTDLVLSDGAQFGDLA